MIKKEDITKLVEEHLQETDMFLVRLSIGKENKIFIYIDGDSHVNIDDCVALSRYVENQLDRDHEDFELNVSSAGIGEPLLLKRQYRNKLQKPVEILLNQGEKFKAILLDIADDSITIAREVKSKKKKKGGFMTGEQEVILFDDIKHTKEIINI